jgi:peptidoglycan hydrolase-like protein with peptidoglycan-binding domain
MIAKNLLKQFSKISSVENYLYENSANSTEIKLIQLCLNDLGFGTELNFERFGADGQYGKSSIQAIKAFAKKHDFESDGEKITEMMLEKMIALAETPTSKALNDFLTQIKTTDSAAAALTNGSKYENEITTLQKTLYNIGYGTHLNWDKYGADGDYGNSTVAGVLAFIQKNNLDGNGGTVTLDILKKAATLDEVVPHLRTLNKTVGANETIKKASDKAVVKALQNMLYHLGYDAELNWDKYQDDGDFGSSSIAAVQAFAGKETLTFDGNEVTIEISQKIISFYENDLGDDWKNIQNQASIESIKMTKIGKRTYEVTDGILTQNFSQTKLQGFTGMATYGARTVKTFIENHQDLLENQEISDSSLRVIQAVEVNEGKLDAINSYDSAYFSFGIFQWTIGQKNAAGELPALLKKIKENAPAIFQEYFGIYGLDVSDNLTNTTYGYLLLNNQLIKEPSQKEQFRTPQWAFIFWKAGQNPIIQSFEIGHAIARFKNFYWRKNSKYLNGHSISEYITSEYGVALLLDQNVNRPNDVYVYTEKALNTTGLKNPETWTTAQERQFINTYIKLRNDSKMWDPKKRADNTTAFVKNGIISDERNSFQYNEMVARGSENIVQPPADFNQESYPEIMENQS